MAVLESIIFQKIIILIFKIHISMISGLFDKRDFKSVVPNLPNFYSNLKIQRLA